MSESYVELHIVANPSEQEILIAQLDLLEFDSYWQKDEVLIAYISEKSNDKDLETAVGKLLADRVFEFKKMEAQNWNHVWESNFTPVIIDDFCVVRAEHHSDLPKLKHLITIRPKMAFGTAHHETSFMMIQMMSQLNFNSKKVVDFGCGTGILAILASKMGAAEIIAFDHEPPSIENSKEHIELNKSKNVEVHLGGIDFLDDVHEADVVLANINRSVLLEACLKIHDTLKPNGLLLMSGILIPDQEIIINKYSKYFRLVDKKEKGEWTCFLFKKQNDV